MFGKKKKDSDWNRELHLINGNAPFAYTEAFKSLRTNIEFLASTNNYHTFMVTSASPMDGKSTVTINLAVALADSDKAVVLVDCDFRKGSVANYLNISRRAPGITNVLARKATLDDVLVSNDDLNIDILPVGPLPANPAEIIGSERMVAIIQQLSEEYDYVIIDTPPVSVVTDAAIMSRYVDGVLLVARADVTLKQALAFSKKSLDDVNARVLGVVLNDYNVKNHSYGGGYYSYSYKYGYGYGKTPEDKEEKKHTKK